MPTLIFTCAPASDSLALAELRSIDPGARLVRRLEPGVSLLEASMPWDDLRRRVAASPPIWSRHLHPVQARLPVSNSALDLPALEALTLSLLMGLDTERSFSVQTRLLNDDFQWQYSRFDVNERLAALVAGWGAPLDVRAPAQVLSVTLAPTEGFLGLSLAADNLSPWAGGEQRFKRDPDQVSRAEFKLLEALAVFHLDLPTSGQALDLGAAPGGWTRLLAGRGLEVTAVDPADLDPRVAALKGVRHLRRTVQEAGLSGRYDLLVNDMRMDARDSARLMVDALRWLKPGGLALMTLKLPEDNPGPTAAAALAILRSAWDLLGARQLFHNRSEITVALQRPSQ